MTQPSLLAIAFQDVKADMSASESSLDKRTGVLDVKQGRRMDEVKLAIKARVGKLDRVLAGGGGRKSCGGWPPLSLSLTSNLWLHTAKQVLQ